MRDAGADLAPDLIRGSTNIGTAARRRSRSQAEPRARDIGVTDGRPYSGAPDAIQGHSSTVWPNDQVVPPQSRDTE